jgi:hypothetical protein
MDTSISWLAIALATISGIVVGGLWYSPLMFVKRWMKETNMSDTEMQKRFPKAFPWLALAAFLTAFVLAHFTLYAGAYTGMSGIANGLTTAFWAWLGLAGAAILAHGALDTRHPYVLWVNLGNRFATLMVMGAIIGLLQ